MARRILPNIKNFRELASKEFSYIRRLTLKVERRLKKPPRIKFCVVRMLESESRFPFSFCKSKTADCF
ncbi:MAG: hypothetical protein Q6352_014450 [Candidatus Freyrarchaeum guaymaensis]